ncbi:MAG: hypothetical protein ACM3O4_04660 [Ignavibacteriales bacterium]
MKKVFSLLMICLLLVGCGVDKDIKKSYKNTDVSDKMNGYQLDLRIKGNYNGKQVNEIVRITNYMDKQIKIKNSASSSSSKQEAGTEEYILVLDNKTYKVTDNKYEEIKDEVAYSEPSLYLDILDNLTKGEEKRVDKIGDISYKVYDVSVKQSAMKEALKGTKIEDIAFKTDIRGEVWINPEGYIYKAIYYLNEAIDSTDMLQLTTLFFSYNAVKEMSLPKEQATDEETTPKETETSSGTGTETNTGPGSHNGGGQGANRQ